MHARAGRHRQGEQHFVGARRIRDADLDRVEMAAHVGGVDMSYRHVEARARPRDLLGGRHDRHRPPERLPHRIAAWRVPKGPMLDLARRADDRALAVALDRLGIAAERGDQRSGHVEAERLQVVGEADDLLDVSSGEGVLYDGEDCGAAIGRFRNGAAFVEDLLDQGDALAKLNRRHGATLLRCWVRLRRPGTGRSGRRRRQDASYRRGAARLLR